MDTQKALRLRSGALVTKAGELLSVIYKPEARNWCGRAIVRVPVKDDLGRTHVCSHDEIHPIQE